MPRTEFTRRKALWAENKADEASASSAPWALKNLRMYQNLASKFWGEHYAALRAEDQPGVSVGDNHGRI